MLPQNVADVDSEPLRRKCRVNIAPHSSTAATNFAQTFGEFGLTPRTRLHHPLCLLLGRQPAVRRELVDQLRQILTKTGEQIVALHAGLLTQRVERIATERFLQIVGRNLLVWTAADPGLGHMALSALLE